MTRLPVYLPWSWIHEISCTLPHLIEFSVLWWYTASVLCTADMLMIQQLQVNTSGTCCSFIAFILVLLSNININHAAYLSESINYTIQ